MNINSQPILAPPPPPPQSTTTMNNGGGVLGANDMYYQQPNYRQINQQMNEQMNQQMNQQMNYQQPNYLNSMGYQQRNDQNHMNYRQSNYRMNYQQPYYQNTTNYPINRRNQMVYPNNRRYPNPMNYEYNNYPRMNYQNNNYQRNYGMNPNNNRMNGMIPNQNYRIFRNTNRNRSQSRNRLQYNNVNQRPFIRPPQQNRSRQINRNGPRIMRLNDFMPPILRDNTPDDNDNVNLLSTAPTTASSSRQVSRSTTPIIGLPQRRQFVTTPATDATQPFDVNDQGQEEQQGSVPQVQQSASNYQQRRTTTTSFQRRQRRIRQEQYRQINPNVNRFNVLNDELDYVVQNDNIQRVDRNLKKQQQRKRRLYLENNRIMSYLQKNSTPQLTSRGNQAYILASSPLYDEWVRDNYELQIWQAYLKMGTEQKHWAKDVVKRTKKRDDNVCTRFVQKKINQLSAKIAEVNAVLSDLKIQLNIYWAQVTTAAIPSAAATMSDSMPTMTTTSTTTNRNIREPAEKIERYILKYIHHCTQHVKKLAENKVRLAKLQMEEFKALEDFEQIATPLQWNIHLSIKPKMKLWATKTKNFTTASRRVQFDLLPAFINKVEFSFKVDESIISKEEAQELYNQMQQVTRTYRSGAMNLYLQIMAREKELLDAEMKRIIEGFPKDNDHGIDAEPGFAAFKQYQDLRMKRINLEVDQSIYFLEEQRVEGESENQAVIVAPALTRSLGEDFLLQLS